MSSSGAPKTPSEQKTSRVGSPISPLTPPTSTSSTSRSLSGELPRSSSNAHRRSHSCTSAPSLSPPLPAGNICPSGKVGKMTPTSSRSDVLGSGSGNYGHGSIVRNPGRETLPPDPSRRAACGSGDAEEMRRSGNELFRKRQFAEALAMYERAILLIPGSVACRSNRAAALAALGRVVEAVAECEAAVAIDPTYSRAHQRLAGLYLRLGQIEKARKHLYTTGEQPDQMEVQKLQMIEKHINRSMDARRIGDWKYALKESDAAIACGADSSTLLFALRAEALLQLHRLEEADSTLAKTIVLEAPLMGYKTRFFGMLLNSYLCLVRARVNMALGRFEDAESSAEKAHELDPENKEVITVTNIVRSVGRARALGNELFNSGKFAEACQAYADGLTFDPSNPVLYCNRAVCQSKLGLWEKSIADCNEALRIQPGYTKALLRRAASYAKLERWTESVRDYEVLTKELPHDNDIAQALHHARDAWKASRGMEGLNLMLAGESENIMSLEKFQAATQLPGVSVVCFTSTSSKQSLPSSISVDVLQLRHPSINFLKVDIEKCSSVAKFECVRMVPAFKIYKNGILMKEMSCPSQQILEQSLRHYSSA